MPITSTPSNLSNLAKGSLAAKISAAQTSGITVTADAYTTASGTKYGQFPTGNSILKLTSTTQSNVTKVEFMGVESASQTGAAVTLGTCIRDLDWEDGSDFTSQSDGLAFPAGTTVELVWTVQHAENTPFKNNANTFTAKQDFDAGIGATVFADKAALDAVLGDYSDGDTGFYVTAEGLFYNKAGGAWVAVGDTGTANASETVAGKVELATATQENAGTDTGDTGAPTFVRPSNVTTVDNLASTEEGLGSALVGHEGGTTVKAKLDAVDITLGTISTLARKLYANTAASSAAGGTGTTEKAFDVSYSIPAGSLAVGDVLKIKAVFTKTNASVGATDNSTVRLKLGSTTIGIVADNDDAAGVKNVIIETELVIRSIGESGAIYSSAFGSRTPHPTDGPSTAFLHQLLLGVNTFDTTGALSVNASIQFATDNGSNTAILQTLTVIKYPS
jgi:hypothetical protein